MINLFVKELNKQKNKGSAMVTVIVIVSFISIMGTILLYVSGMNYQMKVTDYKTKESFYGAEEVVEVIRTQIIIDANTAAQKAFDSVICDYSYYADLSVQLSMIDPTSLAYKDARKALSLYQTTFSNYFRDNFATEWGKRFESTYNPSSEAEDYYADVVAQLIPGAYLLSMTSSDVDLSYNGYKVTIPIDWLKKDNYLKAQDKVEELNLTAVSDNGTGFTAIISTSFAIVPPTIDYHFEDTGVFFSDNIVDNVFYTEWKKG